MLGRGEEYSKATTQTSRIVSGDDSERWTFESEELNLSGGARFLSTIEVQVVVLDIGIGFYGLDGIEILLVPRL